MIFSRVRYFKCLLHSCGLGEDLAREDAGSRCNGSFLEELLPGMMLLHWFLAIHFTQSKYSAKKSLCRLISSGNVFQQPCQLQRRRWISLCNASWIPDSQLFKQGLFQ